MEAKQYATKQPMVHWRNQRGNQKKAGVAILISDKIEFKMKTVTRNKGHCIMINDQSKKKIYQL